MSHESDENGHTISLKIDGETVQGDQLLVATGRRANIDKLNLEAANIATSESPLGLAYIGVDNRLRTSNKKIFAIGDVSGGPQFTHAAGYHAGIVIRNILFHLPAKVDLRALPRVTYSRPELAHVGLSEEDAISCLVNGFCKDVFQKLPLEFAAEANKLLSVTLEGAVG